MWVAQMPSSWHHQGLFMGMHWIWWGFWLLAAAVLAWAFWRVLREKRSRDDATARREAAEEILRRRFGQSEIDDEEFLHRMRLLRETRPE